MHALEARAERLGLYPGQPLANARAMVQPLRVVPADEKADAALLENIADWCDRFTPLVTLDAPDGLYLDISGAAHLFGGEAAMLKDVLERIADLGFAVRGAIAGTSPGSPRIGTLSQRHHRAAGRRGESRGIAARRRAGLRCKGSARPQPCRPENRRPGAARRQPGELAARLGPDFVRRLRLMLGQAQDPLAPRRPLPDLMAEQRFADPVASRDVIAASLLALAQSLCGLLERQGQGARILASGLLPRRRQAGAHRGAHGAPLRDPAVMLRLLNQKLDALADPLDPGFGFDLIRLEASLAEETKSATVSFDAHENARRQVLFLIDRLSARFGESRVLRFAAQDTHIPEAAAAALPAQEDDFGDGAWPAPADPPLRPLRLLARPEEMSHVMAACPTPRPRAFTGGALPAST